MNTCTITVLHPGDMGVSVARAAREAGHRVLWVGSARSAETVARAGAAGLVDAGSLAGALRESAVVLSVCPPHAAKDTAQAVAASGFTGLYVDANAISPASTRAVGAIVADAGARFVDGGIIGPPVSSKGNTRLYLSGAHAHEAAALFEGSLLRARTLDGPEDAASALKMCYAAWTKGTTALLADIRALASALEVEDALLAEWNESQSGLAARSESAARNNAFKAWRWIAEMHEIADSFAAQDLPDGFHRAAAQIYERLADFKDEREPELARIIAALRTPPG
jgi:3-hydroxyisobutyrate dehydrogenase-like beta-hydroxyacid dehydrogenase